MSVKRIIQESLDKNPLGMKEALEEALQDRVRTAIAEKYAEMTESKDEDDDEDEDEDEDSLDESSDLSDYTVEELEDFMESAEFDQLDEISKKTLGSYIKKAKTDVAGQAYQLGAKDPLKPKASWSKALGREKYIDKAVDRLTKEAAEDLEEISSDLKSRYAKKAQSSLKRATTYKAKAQDDAARASANIDRANSGDRSVNVNKQYDRIDRADAKAAKHDKTIAKRTAGLKRANEEVELSESRVIKSLGGKAKAVFEDGGLVIIDNVPVIGEQKIVLEPKKVKIIHDMLMKKPSKKVIKDLGGKAKAVFEDNGLVLIDDVPIPGVGRQMIVLEPEKVKILHDMLMK